MASIKLSSKNSYRQPFVEALAPDAIVFIEGKRTIEAQYIDENNEIVDSSIDFMNYVSTISVTKGIESVPGSANLTLNAPLHVMEQFINPTRQAFSTMQEIEIYMKGRFLYNDKAQYYPVFWGVISNVAEGIAAGNFRSITLTCQDMMRWLAITQVELSPSVTNSTIAIDNAGQDAVNTGQQPGYASRYVSTSAMGIVRDIMNLSTSSSFLKSQGLVTEGAGVVVREPTEQEINRPISFKTDNDQLITEWQQKFEALASSLNIFGFVESKLPNQFGVSDVIVSEAAYEAIYGATFFDKVLGEGLSSMFPSGALAFNTTVPPIFESQFANRLEVANEAKNQLHLEFYQDVDGTVILKPPFYNMDVRENKIYVIEDLDILNVNIIDDESAVVTRLDVTGVNAPGQTAGVSGNKTQNYGFAIDFNKMVKYGFRVKSINTNFLGGREAAKFYATQELVRMNSLIKNGSITIQGRPELKLGFPVYLPSRDLFGYVTSIGHSFTFGSSFQTTLSITAIRERERDPLGAILKNLLVEIDGATSDQVDIQGKDSKLDDNQPFNSTTDLCGEVGQNEVIRPFFRYKHLDDILRTQGSFRFIQNIVTDGTDDTKVQITDPDGYLIIGGSGNFPYAKELKLTEENLIESKIVDFATGNAAESATSMRIQTSEGATAQRTLSFQQPLTLDQIQSVEPRLNRSKSIIPLTMTLTDDNQETLINKTSSTANAVVQKD